MIQLIYYSIANPSLNKDDVEEILRVSHQNNIVKNITGCLLYYNDAFIQILEGNPEVIGPLYVKIEQDERHYNIRQVYSDTIEERLFKDWSMAFYDLNTHDSVSNNKSNFRNNFIAISKQPEQITVASQLFFDISIGLLNE